jgi:hypothetical protein
MGFTSKKYRVSVYFCHKIVIFAKTIATPMDFERKFEFFKKPIKTHIQDYYV